MNSVYSKRVFLQGAIADHGNMHAETAADVVGDAVSTAARSTSDVMEGHESSQEESTERTYSPASDWQSESSLRAEELRQALDRTTAAESKAAVLQQERDQQQGELMQLMEDIGTLQSQLDALQTEKIEQVCCNRHLAVPCAYGMVPLEFG